VLLARLACNSTVLQNSKDQFQSKLNLSSQRHKLRVISPHHRFRWPAEAFIKRSCFQPPRATGIGFTYSWSRLSAVFSTVPIGIVLVHGILTAFSFVAIAMVCVAVVVGIWGPKTNSVALEKHITLDRAAGKNGIPLCLARRNVNRAARGRSGSRAPFPRARTFGYVFTAGTTK
jgi:hypothetical protein